MSRLPSAETLLRQERSKNRQLAKELAEAKSQISHYRARATTAEQSVAEWKTRFDALLSLPRFDSEKKP